MGDCTCCCCSTFLSLFLLVGFLLYIFLYPNKPDIFIQNAVLTQFDVNSTSAESKTVNYNLTVDVNFRNFNKLSRIQYYRLGVTAFIDGEKLAWASLPVFRQGHKNTTIVTAVMQGRGSIKVSDSGVGFIQTAAEAGVFILNFEVDGRHRFRTAGTKTIKDSFNANCDEVLVPFNSNLTAAASSPAMSRKGFTFKPAKCKYPDPEEVS